MSESRETMMLVLNGDVLGKHRLGDLESKVLRYLMQQEVSYRMLEVIHGSDYKSFLDKLSGLEQDYAKRLDNIYFNVPLDDLVDVLGVDRDELEQELRGVFKRLTQNIFIGSKADDSWCYEPLFSRVVITKKTLIVDMKGSVLNLLLTSDLDRFNDNRFRSAYSNLISNAIYSHLGVDPVAKDNLIEGLNNFRVVIDLEELRRWTHCTGGKYEKFSHFRDRVLETAKKEITAFGDYSLEYTPIKTDRKVTAIEFRGVLKDDVKKDYRTGLLLLNGSPSDYLVIQALFAQRGIQCTVEQAYELCQAYGSDTVRYFVDDLNAVMADQTIKDKIAYIHTVQLNRRKDEEFRLKEATNTKSRDNKGFDDYRMTVPLQDFKYTPSYADEDEEYQDF